MKKITTIFDLELTGTSLEPNYKGKTHTATNFFQESIGTLLEPRYIETAFQEEGTKLERN